MQAIFHTPRNFSSQLTNFLPYQEGVKIIEEINKILETGGTYENFQMSTWDHESNLVYEATFMSLLTIKSVPIGARGMEFDSFSLYLHNNKQYSNKLFHPGS